MSRTEPTLVNGEFRWSPDWITRVLACHLAEQASDFTAAFGFLAQHKGYAVVPGEYQMAADVTAAMLQDIQRIAEQVDVNHGAVEAAVLQAIHRGTQEPNTLQDTLRGLELSGHSRQSHTSGLYRKFLRVWQRFPARFWQMTLEDVRYAEAHMSAFFKLHWLKNPERTQDARWQDLSKLNSAPLPEMAKMSFGQVFCVNAAASAVGFRGVLDYETQVPAEAFDRHAAVVIARCAHAAKLDSRRVQAQSSKGQTAALNALRRELHAIGHSLLAQRKRQGEQRDKVRLYSITPDPRLQELLPFAVLAT